MSIISCPHCGITMAPLPDGRCPACRRDVSHAPARPAPTESRGQAPPAGREGGWETFQQRHHEAELAAMDMAASRPSAAKAAPTGAVVDFQQTLREFTPRLLATPAIVAVNVAVFVVMIMSGVHPIAPQADRILAWGANFGPDTLDGQWWRTVTSMFLHYGVLHIAFNMWVLWSLGTLVERLVGHVGFVVLYFASGIAGSLASLAWNPLVISAGASGAVFGIAGALLGLILLRRDTIPAHILASLRGSLGAFILYNFIFGVAMPGIDMAAHIGGLVAGFLGGMLLSQPLTSAAVSRRWRRNAAWTAASAVVLFAAAQALPAAPPNVDKEVQEFGKIEQRLMESYRDWMAMAHSGQLADADFAMRIKQQILPQWSASRAKLEELRDLPNINRKRFDNVLRYVRLREESWRLQVKALETQDIAALRASQEKWAEAERAMGELRKG